MDMHTNRRSLLGTIVLAPLAVAAVAAPQTSVGASEIERHYTEWRAAYAAHDGPDDHVLDRAEIAIQASRETGPRAAEIKLWVALAHVADHWLDATLVAAGDIDALVANTSLDWETKLVVSAIASLRSGGLN